MSKKKAVNETDSFSLAMGAEIARLRRNKSLSGKELGCLIGVSQQQISRYENGVCEITIVTLCSLLHYLGASLEAYFYFVAKRLERNNLNLYTDFCLLFERQGPMSMNISMPDEYSHLGP